MTACRPIAALELPDLKPGRPPTGKPELTWIAPGELLVDATYQRDVGRNGLALIRKIVEQWDWRRFKAPICVWATEGLMVIDGQHSAIAAASHPDVDTIPVLVVEAELVADRASAFVGTNRDRLPISQMQLHAAAVVAGDENAAAIERVCSACDVRVLRMPPSRGAYRPKDTVAVRALDDLVKRVGEALAIEVLKVLAEAELSPITSVHLRAVEAILVHPEYADQVEPAELTRAIVALGADADKEAKIFAAAHGVPRWRGLVVAWFRKAKKRRKADEPQAAPPPAERPASAVPRRPLGASAKCSGSSSSMIANQLRMGDPRERARRDG